MVCGGITGPRTALTTLQVVIAVDVGATKVSGALYSNSLQILHRSERPTRTTLEGLADPSLTQTLGVVYDLLAVAKDRNWTANVGGIGVPEYVNAKGELGSRECIAWSVQPKDALDRHTTFAWAVESDVRCAARAEALQGAGIGRSSVLFVTASTGVAHCLVLNGIPWAGSRGAAIGLGIMPYKGEDGSSISLESVAGGLGLARRYNEQAVIALKSARDIAKRVAHDEIAASVIREAGCALGTGLAIAAELIDPELIVMGGSLWEGSQLYRDETSTSFESIFHPPELRPSVVTGSLGGDRGLLGAAMFALDIKSS